MIWAMWLSPLPRLTAAFWCHTSGWGATGMPSASGPGLTFQSWGFKALKLFWHQREKSLAYYIARQYVFIVVLQRCQRFDGDTKKETVRSDFIRGLGERGILTLFAKILESPWGFSLVSNCPIQPHLGDTYMSSHQPPHHQASQGLIVQNERKSIKHCTCFSLILARNIGGNSNRFGALGL